ncbi:inositol polyphosphate multikinase isoform X2 [Zootermopsis nevadensis]|nr:inositol polyphosphate multikinase isoform X2 [Zootermopsis nevadensis]XP_021922266.1 inositol polyphosphate multikinase isoform X2 [Zootermopsis nevadensis]
MSTVSVRSKAGEKFLKLNGIKATHFDVDDANKNCSLPPNTLPMENQVAGHSFGDGKNTLGMLKHKDGYVLKPIEKPAYGEREIKFYQDLQSANDAVSVELKKLVPKFLGTTTLKINEKDVKFIILDNVANDIAEPCIMDVKIGRQTWDPEASLEKRKNEDQKYSECKQDLGFCIPGFQVHRISTGNVMKLGKDYGKNLNKTTVRDALKLYLNSDSGLSRQMMLQFLASLWRILRWCRIQRRFRLYSSSLLLVYDARRLRQCLKIEGCSPSRPLSPILGRALTLSVTTPPVFGGPFNLGTLSPGFCSQRNSDQFNFSGLAPDKSRNSRSSNGRLSPNTLSVPGTPASFQKQNGTFDDSSWHAGFEKACQTHSLINNYEKDLQSMKENYTFQLNDLKSADKPLSKEEWVQVKMIDFAHPFPSVNDELDTNYLEGIENLVKLFESLLEEMSLSALNPD